MSFVPIFNTPTVYNQQTDVDTIRICSLNAHCGKKLEKIKQELGSANLANCDVILLQEIETAHELNQAEIIASHLGYEAFYLPARPTKRGTHGLAILSKHPMADVERLPLPRNELLINTRDRLAMGATINIGDNQIRIYNVHLDTRITAQQRQRQLHPVIAAAANHLDLPTIIAGDFNTFSPTHTLYLDELLVRAGFSSPFWAGSHHTAKFLFWRPQLDWIYSRKLRVHKSYVEHDSLCSDHKPLWIDASFQES